MQSITSPRLTPHPPNDTLALQPPGVTKQTLTGGFSAPTAVRQIPGSQRLLITEQKGKLHIVDISKSPVTRQEYMALGDVEASK